MWMCGTQGMRRWVLFWRILLFIASIIVTSVHSSSDILKTSSPNSFSHAIESISRRSHSALSQSIPALSVYTVRPGSTSSGDISSSAARRRRHHHSSSNSHHQNHPLQQTIEVAAQRIRTRTKRQLQLPQVDASQLQQTSGFYYGIASETLSKANRASEDMPRKPKLSESMNEALEELKRMRLEMESMRKEMQTLQRRMSSDEDILLDGGGVGLGLDPEEAKAQAKLAKRRRARECEKLATEIEDWAMRILEENEDDGWKEISCNKMMKKSLNPTGRTHAYLKWMRDSRGDKAVKGDEHEYPCIKCVSTIDAPLEDVCTYLSQESSADEYNEVVHIHKDVEEISSNAKICWTQSPQILFLKPRDFVTFCHHRWKGDGTEVMVNQAVEHPDYPGNNQEKEGKACRAYALRGANIFTKCPEDPEKTKIYLVAHANPGGGVPKWAEKTAVNALAPVEPFKLFHKINEHVQRNRPQLRERLLQAEMVGANLPRGRSGRPAGMAQLGYACFWPEGGGIYEGTPQNHHSSDGDGDRNNDFDIDTDNNSSASESISQSDFKNSQENVSIEKDEDINNY